MKTIILVTLFVALFLESNVSATASPNTRPAVNIGLFITVCGIKESDGNDYAIGDKHLPQKAYGYLQVRQPCLDDVNRRFGTKYKAQDLLGNRALSVWVCRKYLEIHATPERLGHEPTYEDMARIWNGGPCGAFDNGAVNKKGDLLKIKGNTPAQNRLAQQRLAQVQLNAKRYAVGFQKILISQMIAKK